MINLVLFSSWMLSSIGNNHRANQFDIGYPFEYFIPSTLYDSEVPSAQLEFRKSLIELTFLSNYGGVTIDTWTSTTGSYLAYSGLVIREKIAIALVYMTENEFNSTFNELINDLNIINCLWWQQESYLYAYKTDAKIVLCQQVINNTQWAFCTDPVDKTIERQIKCGLYWNDTDPQMNEWNKCQQIPINEGETDIEQSISELISNCTNNTVINGTSNDDGNDAYNAKMNVVIGFVFVFLISCLFV